MGIIDTIANILTSGSLVGTLLILAGVAAIQFYAGRKKNLRMMTNYINILESSFNIQDKEYKYLGGYIGFRSEYEVKNSQIKEFKTTLTLKPRHSIFHYPISMLLTRHDKLYLTLKLFRDIESEAHVIEKGYYRLGSGVDNREEFYQDVINIDNKKFELLYKDKKTSKKLLNSIKTLKESGVDLDNIKHYSITPKTDVVYAFIDPDIQGKTIGPVIEQMKELSTKITEKY